jgi:Na+(H+)/acetate symporter ActP
MEATVWGRVVQAYLVVVALAELVLVMALLRARDSQNQQVETLAMPLQPLPQYRCHPSHKMPCQRILHLSMHGNLWVNNHH